METASLKAEPRPAKGTRSASNLRRAGRLPGVIYGEGKPPELIHLGLREFETALRHHSRVLDLELGDRKVKVLVQEVQWSSLGDAVNHVDFLRISQHASVEVNVEIEFVGHPRGISKGGEFMKHLSDLHVRCAPGAIPASIPVLVGELDVEESVLVKDLDLPAGVEALHEPDEVVCVVHIKAVVEEAPAEEEEAEETAEPEVISRGKEEPPPGS